MAHTPGAIVIATLDKGDEYLLNAVSKPTLEEFQETLARWGPASTIQPPTPIRRAYATGARCPAPDTTCRRTTDATGYENRPDPTGANRTTGIWSASEGSPGSSTAAAPPPPWAEATTTARKSGLQCRDCGEWFTPPLDMPKPYLCDPCYFAGSTPEHRP